MAKANPYEIVLVESYKLNDTSGKHGKIHISPVAGYKYPSTLQVE